MPAEALSWSGLAFVLMLMGVVQSGIGSMENSCSAANRRTQLRRSVAKKSPMSSMDPLPVADFLIRLAELNLIYR